jgi:hypothetical protein
MKHAYTSIEYLTPTFGEQGTGTKRADSVWDPIADERKRKLKVFQATAMNTLLRPDKDTLAQCAPLSERKFTNHILQLQAGRKWMLPVTGLNRK